MAAFVLVDVVVACAAAAAVVVVVAGDEVGSYEEVPGR